LSGRTSRKNGAILEIGIGIASCEINNYSFTVKGGWGFPLADLGSGRWLGLSCFQETLNVIDGIIFHSPLTQSILLEYNDSNAIPIMAKSFTSTQYVKYAKNVIEHYKQSDRLASVLINAMTFHIESSLQMIFQKKPERVSLVCGLAQFVEPLLCKKTQVKLSKPFGSAASGALLLANIQLQ
jgi:glucosamine kinase